MTFTRGKTQILYSYLPGAVFAHDDYGHCRVTGIELNSLADVNRAALCDAVRDVVAQWEESWQTSAFPPLEDENSIARNFVVGEPASVYFEPYPKTFVCQRCLRVFSLTEVMRAGHAPGRCIGAGCNGSLMQMRFVQAHNCGRLDEIFVNRQGCAREGHGRLGLYFDDTGRVSTARWRCRLCGGAEVARLRQTPCDCAYSAHGTSDPNEKRLKFLSITDPAVFKPHIVPFVNFSRETIGQLDTVDARPLVMARLWGILETPVRESLAQQRRIQTESVGETEGLVKALEAVSPDHPLVQQFYARQAQGGTTQSVTRQIESLLGGASKFDVSRRMLEQVALLDSLSVTGMEELTARAIAAGDIEKVEGLKHASAMAASELGIEEMLSLDDFPIGLCALGFTRIRADPSQSVLNPFPRVGQQTPLYAVLASTEAIYLRLDPLRVLDWVQANRLVQHNASTRAEAWAFLHREVPGLRARRDDASYNAPTAAAIRTLIHTLSHVLLRHIEWSGYSAQSIGEYMIPEGLSVVLYASRYTDARVGGLLTLFEQGLLPWLQESSQQGSECVLDPFCGAEGGACVGCLHREHNCTEFNRELSRAVLYGGTVPVEGQAALPFGPTVAGFWNPRID